MRSFSSRAGGGKKAETGLKRGPWTAEEDELLRDYIKREGEGGWRTLPKKAGLLRCGKSCRLRWMNYLRPNVKRGRISEDEEDLILRLHRLLGNRWSLIAGRIPGRTDNEIKNYWNTHLSRKLISQGIDPKTHQPFDPNPSFDKNQSLISNPNPSFDQNQSLISNPNPSITKHNHSLNQEGDEDCCNDEDSLSSFLNSLINDEMFSSHHQQ